MSLTVGDQTVIAEITASESDRARGLMGRKNLPKNHGMLFIFETERVLSFWMKNTLIPLDIAFIDQSGKILQVETMTVVNKGESPPQYRSRAAVRYALEVNAGWFEKHGILPGVRIPELARKP